LPILFGSSRHPKYTSQAVFPFSSTGTIQGDRVLSSKTRNQPEASPALSELSRLTDARELGMNGFIPAF
jgi:hypothetical protein